MQKMCPSACFYSWNNQCSLYNSCCCNQRRLPRSCTSCIIASLRKDDEWKLYNRCLTGFYTKNVQSQFTTPLWCRAERQRAKAASTTDLAYHNKSAKKGCKRIARPAEIVIERNAEKAFVGDLLNPSASKPTYIDQCLAQLLMQRKLYEKSNCDPYESVPDVPLAFYPKLASTTDTYVQAPNQLWNNATWNGGRRCSKCNEGISKAFLKSINKLYANVGGGGSDGQSVHKIYNHRKRRRSEMEKEFKGFFAEPANTSKTDKDSLRSYKSTMMGVDNFNAYAYEFAMDNLLKKSRSAFQVRKSEKFNPYRKKFIYPTSIPEEKRGQMSFDAKAVKKYLNKQIKSSHSMKQISFKQLL
ncbi:uncharacterized protein [Eurosta solidaginis]|uniref:uncharacterized protein n=1 Tax=Eurosta solidaginis TaxID=178769 RepID=UPI0035311364